MMKICIYIIVLLPVKLWIQDPAWSYDNVEELGSSLVFKQGYEE